MPDPQPFRFGIVRNQTLPWPVLLDHVRRFEACGFDSLWLSDHFQRPSGPEEPLFEGWMTLAALAAKTERLRLGILVTSNTFRTPGLVAKEAVTVDHISNGRVEVGLGTGWYKGEHERIGIPFPDPPELVDRFEEAIQIVDMMLRNETSSFDGTYYTLKDALTRPLPIQRPRPPITLGAHGPRMLRIAARFADRWNSYGPVDDIRERNARLDEACAAIGRDPREIIRSFFGMAPRLTMAGRLPTDPWASPDAFADAVERYRAVGINEFLVDGPEPHQLDVMERVASDVMPAFRASA
jgi:F420-dependent oxidoreductase-like protein